MPHKTRGSGFSLDLRLHNHLKAKRKRVRVERTDAGMNRRPPSDVITNALALHLLTPSTFPPARAHRGTCQLLASKVRPRKPSKGMLPGQRTLA